MKKFMRNLVGTAIQIFGCTVVGATLYTWCKELYSGFKEVLQGNASFSTQDLPYLLLALFLLALLIALMYCIIRWDEEWRY